MHVQLGPGAVLSDNESIVILICIKLESLVSQLAMNLFTRCVHTAHFSSFLHMYSWDHEQY